MRIGIINGPNLNRLGKRKPERYGTATLDDLLAQVNAAAAQLGVEIVHIQSNHEGHLIDWLHENGEQLDGLILNPAGLTPYGRPLLDAVHDTELPYAIVHISQLYKFYGANTQDLFKEHSAVYVCGLGHDGYVAALGRLQQIITEGKNA